MKFEIRGVWIIILALLIGAAIMFLFKTCSNNNPVPVVVNVDSLQLVAKIRAKIDDSTLAVIETQDSIYRQKERYLLLVHSQTVHVLEEQLRLVSAYRKQLNYYATLPSDTVMVPVHPSYVLYCDSLADATVRTEDNYYAFKQEAATMQDNLKNQLSLKDREIMVYQKGKQELESQNAWLSKGVNEIATKNKHRNAVYFGLVANGDKINPIRAGGMGLTFVNKKGWLLGADALMHQGGGLLYQARIGWKIKFR